MNNTDLDPGHINLLLVREEDKYMLIQCNKHPVRKNTPGEHLSGLGRPACFQQEVCICLWGRLGQYT